MREKLDALIGDIYDAATLPEMPISVLEKAALLTGSSAATLDIAGDNRFLKNQVFGADDAFCGQVNEFFDQNLFAQRRHLFTPGRAMFGRDLASDEELKSTAWWNEFLVPAGTVHLLNVVFFRQDNLYGGLALWREAHVEPHETTELEIGHILAGHLRRAFQFGLHFRAAAARTQRIETAIDTLATGCMLIDAHGRIVQANSEAMQVLSRGGALRLVGGKVEPVAWADRQRWQALLARLSPGGDPPTGTATVLEGSGGRLVLHAVPLRPMHAEVWGVSLGAEPFGLVIMLPSARSPKPSEELLMCTAFGLTAAEAELGMALLNGESLRDYADRRSRSVNTVKTHLKAVFAKTGTTRQAELVRELAALRLLASHNRN